MSVIGHSAYRREGDAVRIVRVDHVGAETLHDAGESPRRRQVHLRPRGDGNQLEAFVDAAPELAVRMRDERGSVRECERYAEVRGRFPCALFPARAHGGNAVLGQRAQCRDVCRCRPSASGCDADDAHAELLHASARRGGNTRSELWVEAGMGHAERATSEPLVTRMIAWADGHLG